MPAFENHLAESLIKSSPLKKKENVVQTAWKNKGVDPLEGACGSLMKNVQKNGYLQYGLYWWAVKKILLKNGFLAKDNVDEKVANIYSGDTDLKTLILAYAFADYYNGNLFQGTCEFDINETETYVLFDEEFEF